MPDGAIFDSFERELARLVDIFGKNLAAYKSAAYDEASLRQEFLNPLFRALGWDIENAAGLIPQRREVVEAIHRHLREAVDVDDVRVCYHDDADGCDCRKPKPGLLLTAARDWGVDLTSSFMIGDRWRDVEAGQRAGCATVLIQSGQAAPISADPTVRVSSLRSAVRWIRDQVRQGAGVGPATLR